MLLSFGGGRVASFSGGQDDWSSAGAKAGGLGAAWAMAFVIGGSSSEQAPKIDAGEMLRTLSQ